MISQFVSPISNKIFMDYDPGMRFKKEQSCSNQEIAQAETMLGHGEHDMRGLQGHVYMELLVHIYQSINFLQNLEISEEVIHEKQIDLRIEDLFPVENFYFYKIFDEKNGDKEYVAKRNQIE